MKPPIDHDPPSRLKRVLVASLIAVALTGLSGCYCFPHGWGHGHSYHHSGHGYSGGYHRGGYYGGGGGYCW